MYLNDFWKQFNTKQPIVPNSGSGQLIYLIDVKCLCKIFDHARGQQQISQPVTHTRWQQETPQPITHTRPDGSNKYHKQHTPDPMAATNITTSAQQTRGQQQISQLITHIRWQQETPQPITQTNRHNSNKYHTQRKGSNKDHNQSHSPDDIKRDHNQSQTPDPMAATNITTSTHHTRE